MEKSNNKKITIDEYCGQPPVSFDKFVKKEKSLTEKLEKKQREYRLEQIRKNRIK